MLVPRVLAAMLSAFLALPAAAASAQPSPQPTDAHAFSSDGQVTVTAHPLTPQNAPADEYFGRLKLSNLGVRNIIHALAVEGDSPLALPAERSRIMAVQTAILQWADRYPRDTWLRNAEINFATVIAQKNDPDTSTLGIDMLLQTAARMRGTSSEKTALARANAIVPVSTVDWTTPPFDPPSIADVLSLFVLQK